MSMSDSPRMRELTNLVEESERACQQERAKLDRLIGDLLRVDQERCKFGATQLDDNHLETVVRCLRVSDQVSRQLNVYLTCLEQLGKRYGDLMACRQVSGCNGQLRRERTVEDIVSPLWP